MSPASAEGDGGAEPRFAILFWFFKDFDTCRARAEALRARNPGVALYGLYGGPPEEAGAARAAMAQVLDDLHVYAGPEDSYWKWIHGDQLIADWHARRGRHLPWRQLLVAQWDLLLAAPLSEIAAELRPDEAAFTGDRPLAEVATWWGWAGRGGEVQAAEMAAFRALLVERLAYSGPLWCCLFIAAVLPRAFLDAHQAAGAPAPGFLEYKLPTLARVFGTPVRALPQLAAWWRKDPATQGAPLRERVLNATREPVDPAVIAAELARPGGRRAFHPVFELTPWG
ncbi:MAG: hypothetical protein INR64_13085 [Caulobacteraceae bacterium]|nr:hypothetical protein [Caulobacter sp.]